MSSIEDVLYYDPQMKVAMAIADQQGLDKSRISRLYGEVIMGEVTVQAFFDRLLLEVTDADLRRALEAVTPRRLPGRTPEAVSSRTS